MRLGWFEPVPGPTVPAQEVRPPFTTCRLLVGKLSDLDNAAAKGICSDPRALCDRGPAHAAAGAAWAGLISGTRR